jgi:hypothetical protein
MRHFRAVKTVGTVGTVGQPDTAIEGSWGAVDLDCCERHGVATRVAAHETRRGPSVWRRAAIEVETRERRAAVED